METFDAGDESQIAVFRQADIKRYLALRDDSVAGWHATREVLKRKGAFCTGQLTLSRIAASSLILGQISLVVEADYRAAAGHFSFPASLNQPTFKELSAMVAQGQKGSIMWDGQLLGMASELERLISFLLVGRLNELIQDYADCNNPALFEPTDQTAARAFLAWQIFHCVTGQYDKVSFADFGHGITPFKKQEFGFGYEHLLDAIARGDCAAFSRELAVREMAFGRRQRSRKKDRLWGYGYEGRDCFDVFGCALCRLAHVRGMNFTIPSDRFYPPVFWQGFSVAI